MSSFINKIKSKFSSSPSSPNNKGEEQQFSIQPHPAKTNDPADLQPNHGGGGLRSDPIMGAHNAKGPHIPSAEIQNNLPAAMGHDEYQQRTAELNAKH